MTNLAYSPTDDYDLLALVADPYSAPGKVRMDDFRAACLADAQAHGGYVHPSRVSALLHQRFGELNARSLSAKWAPACGADGFLDKTDVWSPIDPEFSKGNSGKAVRLRMWRGWTS